MAEFTDKDRMIAIEKALEEYQNDRKNRTDDFLRTVFNRNGDYYITPLEVKDTLEEAARMEIARNKIIQKTINDAKKEAYKKEIPEAIAKALNTIDISEADKEYLNGRFPNITSNDPVKRSKALPESKNVYDKELERLMNKAKKNPRQKAENAESAVKKILERIEKEAEQKAEQIIKAQFEEKNILEKALIETKDILVGELRVLASDARKENDSPKKKLGKSKNDNPPQTDEERKEAREKASDNAKLLEIERKMPKLGAKNQEVNLTDSDIKAGMKIALKHLGVKITNVEKAPEKAQDTPKNDNPPPATGKGK